MWKGDSSTLVFTNNGKIALLKWEFAGSQPGQIERFLPSGLEGEVITNLLPITDTYNTSVGLLTTDGRFKRINLEEILEISGRATTILKLKENVYLQSAVLCPLNGYLIIVSNIGRIIKLQITSPNFVKTFRNMKVTYGAYTYIIGTIGKVQIGKI